MTRSILETLVLALVAVCGVGVGLGCAASCPIPAEFVGVVTETNLPQLEGAELVGYGGHVELHYVLPDGTPWTATFLLDEVEPLDTGPLDTGP